MDPRPGRQRLDSRLRSAREGVHKVGRGKCDDCAGQRCSSRRPDPAGPQRRRRHRRRRRARRAAAPPTGSPRAGLDVLLLEKTSFPREKVCGDGLTPRGTRALVDMGIDVSEEAGWLHNRGLRVIGGGLRLHLDWPELTSFPPYGLVRPRADLDALLAHQAVKAGARLHEQTTVTEPILDARRPRRRRQATTGRTRRRSSTARRSCSPATASAASSRSAWACTATTSGRSGVAVRRYYTSPQDPRRLPRVAGSSSGTATRRRRVQAAARLRLDLRHGRRHGQRRPRRAQLQRRLPEDRLPRPAHPLARQHARGVGPARAERDLPHPRRRRCRWGSTARRTTCAGCCSSAIRAARSTRSTARASRTRWSPASSPPRRSCRRWPGRTGPGASVALQAYPRRMRRGVGRLLPARRRCS